MADRVSVTITQQQDYQFLVDFGAALPTLLADEPPPLGQGQGPKPTHMLLAAAANCLSASLLFALRKFKQDPGRIITTATADIGRNDAGRLRVLSIDVMIHVDRPAQEIEHLDRILGQFEDFCTVSQSIQSGVPIQVHVTDGTGAAIKSVAHR